MISLCRCMILFSFFFNFRIDIIPQMIMFFLIMNFFIRISQMICALSRTSYTAYKKKERKKVHATRVYSELINAEVFTQYKIMI